MGFGGYAVKAVRDAEDLLPDHDAEPAGKPEAEVAPESASEPTPAASGEEASDP